MKQGDRYGRWTLVRLGPHGIRRGQQRSRWTCRCVCGTTQPVFLEDLQLGRSTGCADPSCRVRHAGLLDALQVVVPEGVRLRLESAAAQEDLERGARLPVGWAIGRWLVVRSVAPRTTGARRRPAVVVECVCGVHALKREDELKAGRSLGCTSARCRIEWRGAVEAYERTVAALEGDERSRSG